MSKCILVIGAYFNNSKRVFKNLGRKKAHIYIVARSIGKLTTLKFDLIQRGAISVHIFELDLNNQNGYDKMLESAIRQLKIIDIMLIAHGLLPDQKKAKDDSDLIYEVFKINSLSVILIITKLLKQFEKQRFGSIGVISSVAGDRIKRASNYIYGTTKATVSLFCDGLRVELEKIGVSLTDIKPGYVNSNMTKNLSLLPYF